MNAERYSEVSDWRGFGNIFDAPTQAGKHFYLGNKPERIRLLGMAGRRVRAEYLDRPGRTRERIWLTLDQLPTFAKSLAQRGMLETVPADYLATARPLPQKPIGPLFRQT